MKAVIKDVQFHKEYESKFGVLYSFKILYDDKTGFYSSKYKDQNKFVKGRESEFTEEKKSFINPKGEQSFYYAIKPLAKERQSNFGKALKKEQTKYSGFAVSYAKDMVVAGKLSRDELPEYAWVLFELMVEMDKSIEQ